MKNTYRQVEIAEGVRFHEILDLKFKTNHISFRITEPISEKLTPAEALASMILTSCNKTFSTIASMMRQLHCMYGAELHTSLKSVGDLQSYIITGSTIADKYALEQEPLLRDLLQLMLDCLFEPSVENGAFDGENFRLLQIELLANIEAQVNDKRYYSMKQAKNVIYQNEPCAFELTKEDVQNLTAQEVYEAYRHLLENGKIEIFYVGSEQHDEVEQLLRQAFAYRKKSVYTAEQFRFLAPSPVKEQVAEVEESLSVGQCKLVMAWKTPRHDRAARMVSALFGGTPSSKLFCNVREKMSLCYYCQAQFVSQKQTMLVDSGIETENIEKAKQAILEQLESIKNGEISEEEWNSVLMSVRDSSLGTGNTPSSYIGWYVFCMIEGEDLTPEENYLAWTKITREEVMQAAKEFQLDTIYVLKPEQKEGEDGND